MASESGHFFILTHSEPVRIRQLVEANMKKEEETMCRFSHLLEHMPNRPAEAGEELEISAFKLPGVQKMIHGFISPADPSCLVCIPDGTKLEIQTPVQCEAHLVTFIETTSYHDLVQFEELVSEDKPSALSLQELPLGTRATVMPSAEETLPGLIDAEQESKIAVAATA